MGQSLRIKTPQKINLKKNHLAVYVRKQFVGKKLALLGQVGLNFDFPSP